MQPDLFRMMNLPRVETPAARRTDPATSHAAAAEVTRTGVRGHQQRQVAAAVREWPGRTAAELAKLASMDRYAVSRRLPECVTAGGVLRGEARRCEVNGRDAQTWWPR